MANIISYVANSILQTKATECVSSDLWGNEEAGLKAAGGAVGAMRLSTELSCI